MVNLNIEKEKQRLPYIGFSALDSGQEGTSPNWEHPG